MALQTSGAISLANIQSEFGGSNPIGLNEYYGAASGIPASGAIDFADFYGKSSGPPVNRYGTYNVVNENSGLTVCEFNLTGVNMTADARTSGTVNVSAELIVSANRGSQTGSDIIIPNSAGTHFYKLVGMGVAVPLKIAESIFIFEPLNGAPKPASVATGIPMGTATGVPHPQQPQAVSSTTFTTSNTPWLSINGGSYWGYSGLYYWQADQNQIGFFLAYTGGPATFTFDPSYTV